MYRKFQLLGVDTVIPNVEQYQKVGKERLSGRASKIKAALRSAVVGEGIFSMERKFGRIGSPKWNVMSLSHILTRIKI